MNKLNRLLLRAAKEVGLELSDDMIVIQKLGPRPLINFVVSTPMKVIVVFSPELERMMK